MFTKTTLNPSTLTSTSVRLDELLPVDLQHFIHNVMLVRLGENLEGRFQNFTTLLILVIPFLMHLDVELLTRTEHALVALKSVKFVHLLDVIAQFFWFLKVTEAVRAKVSDVIVLADMLLEIIEVGCVEAAHVLHAFVGWEEAIFSEENLMTSFCFGDAGGILMADPRIEFGEIIERVIVSEAFVAENCFVHEWFFLFDELIVWRWFWVWFWIVFDFFN
jgi:hypothetical protein